MVFHAFNRNRARTPSTSAAGTSLPVHQDHHIFKKDSCSLDDLKNHCLTVHGPQICSELAALSGDQLRKATLKETRDDYLRGAMQDEIIVLE